MRKFAHLLFAIIPLGPLSRRAASVQTEIDGHAACVPRWSRPLSLSLSLSLSFARAYDAEKAVCGKLPATAHPVASGIRDGEDLSRVWRNVIQLEKKKKTGNGERVSENDNEFARLVYQARCASAPLHALPSFFTPMTRNNQSLQIRGRVLRQNRAFR